MAFVYDLTDTWNAGGTTFNAIKMNVTDTASAAASKLITVQVGGAEKFGVRKDGQTYVAGSLGVGTSSPTDKLTVDASTTTGISVVRAGSDRVRAFGDGTLAWGATANQGTLTWNTNLAVIQANSGNSLAFNTNGTTERMRIDSSGRVGVGTSSPAAKLHVSDAANGKILISGTSTSAELELSAPIPKITFTDTSGSAADGEIKVDGNAMQIAMGGTERMRIDSSGRVGIGTTAPDKALTISASDSQIRLYDADGTNQFASIQSDNGTAKITSRNNTSNGTIAFQRFDGTAVSESMRIDSSGRVGIGTTNPQTALEVGRGAGVASYVSVYGNNQVASSLYIGQDAAGLSRIFQNGANPITVWTNSTERMRIDSSGNLLVGTTSFLVSANEKVSFDCGSTNGLTTKTSGGASAWNYFAWNSATSGNNGFIEFGTEGSYTARGSITYNRGGGLVAYNITSDYRAKDILGPVADPGATIDALKVYNGKMKGATIARPMLVAHEAQEVVPYAVTGEKDAVNEDGTDKYQQMDHQVLIPLLIAEIQSLRARVAQLEGN